MNEFERQKCNEEYWADRKAARQPMRAPAGSILDDPALANIAKKILRDATEFGLADSEVQASRKRMLEWLAACKVYNRDLTEVHRECKDAHELRGIVATMRENQELERERIFGG